MSLLRSRVRTGAEDGDMPPAVAPGVVALKRAVNVVQAVAQFDLVPEQLRPAVIEHAARRGVPPAYVREVMRMVPRDQLRAVLGSKAYAALRTRFAAPLL